MTSITTLLNKFKAELLFTNTDSLTYEIKSEDVSEEFFKHKHLFDFSNFSKNSKFYDSQNETVVGKMKDEYKGILINKFVVGKESNTQKGINTSTEFNEFKDTLLNKKIIRHKMKIIQSKKHKIGTYKINKISLLCFDDKRFDLDDGIQALAYFRKDSRKKILKDDHKKKEIQKDSHKKKRFLQMIKD